MNDYLILAIAAFIAGIVGFFIGKTIASLKQANLQKDADAQRSTLQLQLENSEKQAQEHKTEFEKQWAQNNQNFQQQLENITKEREEIRAEKDRFKNELTRRNVEFDNLLEKNAEQKAEVEKLQEKFTKEFENLANKILDKKSEKFTLQNKENLENILNPLQEKIKTFEKRVEDTNKENIVRHSSLQEQLKYLKELNQQITKEASNLTKALKGDTKMQGNWGELVLERILEKSGLQKDSEYTVQNSFTTEEGKRVLPDVVIHLPGNKKMIIDSKVSLIAYEKYVSEENEELRPALLKEHLNSIKKHIDQLSAKNYHDLYQIESPDFVLLFIPIEPAFALAAQNDHQLYSSAFEKNIVIVTPSTLLATLRTIDSMWQNDKQHKNAIAIATQAGRLYDQFKNLLDDLEKVGKQLQTVQNTYSSSMTKLTGRGNLLGRVEKLKKLGAKANKQIDNKWLRRADDDFEEEQETQTSLDS